MTAPYTSDQLAEGVANAIAARNFEAAVDILTVMVSVDPKRAVDIYDDIQAGLRIASALRTEATS